jgi:uncharacterized Rmd1/YagE family protein
VGDTTGRIDMSRNEISKLIGVVFLEKCAVNLLSTVLDTPEFFWDAPDSLQGLYDALCEYLEMEDRVQVRFTRACLIAPASFLSHILVPSLETCRGLSVRCGKTWWRTTGGRQPGWA